MAEGLVVRANKPVAIGKSAMGSSPRLGPGSLSLRKNKPGSRVNNGKNGCSEDIRTPRGRAPKNVLNGALSGWGKTAAISSVPLFTAPRYGGLGRAILNRVNNEQNGLQWASRAAAHIERGYANRQIGHRRTLDSGTSLIDLLMYARAHQLKVLTGTAGRRDARSIVTGTGNACF